MKWIRMVLAALMLGTAPAAEADVSDSPPVRDAIETVEAIDRARRAQSERRLRRLVTSDELVTRLMRGDPARRWPEGPLQWAAATAGGAELRYGTDCVDLERERACIHELALSFVRVDGRMKLAAVAHHGW